jgi:EmrB/QacA subfamily drug resistance transporter
MATAHGRSSGIAPPPPTRGLALAVIAMAQLMVVLDTSIVNVALPSIQRTLHLAGPDLEWVVNAYTIAFGGLLLLGGRSGDLFGRRRVFVTGVLLFTAGSLAGGLAASATFLILARAAQGIGAAIIAPTALSLVADTFGEGGERNRALGVYSAVSAGGGALGLLLGGILTTYVSWRWTLFVNVPAGILLALVAPRVLVAGTARGGRLDLPGALAATAGAGLLVSGLTRAATHGWSDHVTTAVMALAAVLLVAFVLIEASSRQPLMPLRMLRDRTRTGTYVLSLANGAALSGMLYLLTLFLQDVRGFTPLQAGLAFLPATAGVMAGAALTSRLIGRLGPRLPMTAGALLAGLALLWLSRLTVDANYAEEVLGPLVIFSVGQGQMFVSTSVVAVARTTSGDSGIASALLNVGRYLGGSLGIAITGAVATNVATSRLSTGPLTHAVVDRATTAGFDAGFEAAALVAAFGLVIALAAVRRRPARVEDPVPLDAA